MTMAHMTTFLNVDLELQALHGLDELLEAIESNVFVLHRDSHSVALELDDMTGSFEETVVRLVDLIRGLPASAKAIWDQCDLRRFDIGIEGGTEPRATSFALSSSTVSLLAGIQAEVTFTVYAV